MGDTSSYVLSERAFWIGYKSMCGLESVSLLLEVSVYNEAM